MHRTLSRLAIGTLAACLVAAPGTARQPDLGERCVVVPQHRVYTIDGQDVRLASVDADVRIDDQLATTTQEIAIENLGPRPAEAELLLPVPESATVRRFAWEGVADGADARVLPRDEARRIYEEIVRRQKDPALLEFAGSDLVRSSVFPVAPGATQRITLVYEEVLPARGDRIDYVLPRSESFDGATAPWSIDVSIRSSTRGIATIYSPSHRLLQRVLGNGHVTATVPKEAASVPGALRLSALLAGGGVSASVIAFPDPDGPGGCFLLLAGAPEAEEDSREPMRREVTIVIDRSGSMRGEKLEQARASAIAVIDGLAMGEAFNIIDYAGEVRSWSSGPVVKTAATLREARAHLASLEAGGATDLHAALTMAVAQEPAEGMLPMILFLTDGLPTAGTTSETVIRRDTRAANVHGRRIFTFGVGYDLNAPLLDRIAELSRGASINVLPGDSIEMAVTDVFRRLEGPVLARPTLAAGDANRIEQVMPRTLPDLFDGDQLVVLGRYRGEEPIELAISGAQPEDRIVARVTLDPEAASRENAFVARLWASRKIAWLSDAIRQLGADEGAGRDDPRVEELVDEIVRLGTRFGILTEYTAFLATEPESTDDIAIHFEDARDEALALYHQRAMGDRAGQAAVNQAINIKSQQAATRENRDNRFWNADMELVEIRTVQQVSDRALFRRGGRWVDDRIVAMQDADVAQPDRIVAFGSDGHFALARRLAAEGRAALLAARGDVYVVLDDERVLVRGPGG